MAECRECGEYAKNDGWLCPKCYNKQKKSKNTVNKENENEFVGLSDKERDFRYGMIIRAIRVKRL